MTEASKSWIRDDSPVVHKIVRIIFFLTSFSWTLNPIQDYMGESTPVEKIVTRMIPMMIVAAYSITCEHRDKLRRLFRPGMWPFLWYVTFGVFFGLSSIRPALCAWKGVELMIAAMFLTVSCRDADSTRREFLAFLKLLEIVLWATVFLAILNPSLGLRRSSSILPWLQGYLPMLNPNMIGFMSVITLARLLMFPARYKPLRILMASGTLLCSQSRTSYAVTTVVLVIFIIDGIRERQLGRVIVASSFVLLALGFAMGWHEAILRIVMRGQSAEEMGSLSGRTDYWDFALRYVSWKGSGLATGSRSLIFIGEETFHKGTVNMHSSIVEALLGGGYIGAVPFLALIAINILRQGVHALTRPSVSEGFFLATAVILTARGATSIVLAVFSTDFIYMLFLWSWLYTRDMTGDAQKEITRREKPKPVAYEKTLYEQENDQTTCQTAHSVYKDAAVLISRV